MINPSSRRDLFGKLIAGGIALNMTPGGAEGQGLGLAGTTGSPGSVSFIPLFAELADTQLPDMCDLVVTGGYSEPGRGGASYRRDPQVDRVWVARNPRTAFVDAAGRGYRLSESSIDVLQTGALGNGTADDAPAIQAALDEMERAGGGTVLLPPGNYRTLSSLRLPPRTGLCGAGPASVLRVERTDGIVVGAADDIGPRRLADFMLHGRGCEGFRAIVVDLASGKRCQGPVFERLFLAFFGTGVASRGLWHATFRTVTMHQIWRGFQFTGQNVKILIDDCRLTHGGQLRGRGLSIGIQVGDDSSGARAEDVQVARTMVYGFDKAIVWRSALFGGVVHCDLDACGQKGLEMVTADGGFTFANNWINVIGPSGRAIDCVPLGYQPEVTNILIANNNLNGRAASRGSCGIAIGNQQADIILDGNSVSAVFETGISAVGVRRLALQRNKVARAIVLQRCNEVVATQNFAADGLKLDGNIGLDLGTRGGGTQ
ncbi:glycosyl hydrolase family 28-related protein [Sphingomonas sp. FW199]|uniref:glycosyl hydrolase family 28-related protein n=1 Tax=Sphingomonas sp. FW199 TaxID=3400217 RepID=UPI003CE817DC